MSTPESQPSPAYYTPQHARPPVKRTNHVFHAVMTVVTGGIWALVWLVQVLRHRNI